MIPEKMVARKVWDYLKFEENGEYVFEFPWFSKSVRFIVKVTELVDYWKEYAKKEGIDFRKMKKEAVEERVIVAYREQLKKDKPK